MYHQYGPGRCHQATPGLINGPTCFALAINVICYYGGIINVICYFLLLLFLMLLINVAAHMCLGIV